jgi:tetratricopeptide (TPR) repeat protein
MIGQRPRRQGPLALLTSGLVLALLILGAGVLASRFSRQKPPAGPTALVLADLQNFTGEKAFDHVITRMLQIDLGQSPFLQITPDAKVAETLTLMEQPRATPLTPALALTVCARTNGAAMIVPAIASLGRQYLLTLAASSCANGGPLYEDKETVQSREAIPRAVDALSARMRRRLGELSASIARFDVPLAPARTGSFEALRAYSEGEWLSRHGKRLEAIPLYKHAVELDPDFAAAYLALSEAYYGNYQTVEDAEAITKAYLKRGYVSEPISLLIENHYNITVTKNLDAARQSVALMTRLYPNDPEAWSYLSNAQLRLGDFSGAVSAAQRALDLDPQRSPTYTLLARALVRSGQIARAEAIDQQALKLGPESGTLRQQRIALRYLQGDEAGAERLIQTAIGTSMEREALLEAYNFAIASGRVTRAKDYMDRADLLGRADGVLPKFAEEAFNDATLGMTKEGRAALAQTPAKTWTGLDDYYAALLDDPKTAEADLARDRARWPNDTLLWGRYAKEAKAALLLRAGQPRQAVKVLDGVGRLMFVDLDAPYLRSTALLAAKDGQGAAAAFREVLAHPGFGWDAQYTLAHLGLARALRLTGAIQDSRREYERFLRAWRDADADLQPLKQAKAEYAALVASSSSPR